MFGEREVKVNEYKIMAYSKFSTILHYLINNEETSKRYNKFVHHLLLFCWCLHSKNYYNAHFILNYLNKV